MPEQDEAVLREMYSEVLSQSNELRNELMHSLDHFSLERYPENSAYLRSLVRGLGEVAAMAQLAVNRVGSREEARA